MKRIGICLLLCFMLVGCSSKEYTCGSFEGNQYQNVFFHFEMTYPDDYQVYDEQKMAALLGISYEQLQEQSATETKYEYMISNEMASPLFQFFVSKYKFTTAATYDDFIVAIVDQLQTQEEVDYAVGAVQELSIHDVSFHKISLHANAGFYVLNQDLYLFKEKGFVGTLLVTYLDGQEQEVEDIIQTIQLRK
ncbi:MAG: hypothetical protein PUF50_05075 [Erysipelotrichaceae bacterium]|nr:hypothetical protein [Erysipelotrichaceae bacterium]